MTAMKKRNYSVEELRKIVRLEDPGSPIWYPAEKVTFEGTYDMTLDDLETALKTITEKKLPVADVENWYQDLSSNLSAGIGPEVVTHFEYEDDVPWYDFPDNELGALYAVWYLLHDLGWDVEEMADDATGDQIPCVQKASAYLSCFRENQNRPRNQWIYPEYVKEEYIEVYDRDASLGKATKEELNRFVTWVDELAAKGNETALSARCYGKYTGNAAYEQDFMGARDDAEKLFAITQNPQYANTLGYIYYYGRCTHGEPEYDKALKCFTFGAANGLYESIYKLADMYKNGYGVVKSPETAFRLIARLYGELVRKYPERPDDYNFADVALRLGSMLVHGDGTEQKIRSGVSKLLMADYAIKKRLKEQHYYGDNVVAANIRRCLAEAKTLLPPEQNTGKIEDNDFWAVRGLMKEDYKMIWKVQPVKHGDWAITFKRAAKKNEYGPKKLFFTIPEKYFCMFTDKIKGRVTPLSQKQPMKGKADDLEIDYKDKITVLYYDGKPVLKLKGTSFDWRIPKPEKRSGKTVRLVGITFTPGGRQYDYLCDLEDIKPGDKVIVNGYEGEAEVIVQNVTDVAVEELALPLERYKKIERKA